MITNQDITIFNLRLDKKTRREVFIPTNISEVSFVDMRSSGGSASEREENLHFRIRIPVNARVQDSRTYISEDKYKLLDDEEAKKHWTLQKGCYIITGTIFYNGEWSLMILFQQWSYYIGHGSGTSWILSSMIVISFSYRVCRQHQEGIRCRKTLESRWCLVAFKEITTPRGVIIQGKNGKAELKWDSSFVPKTNQKFTRMQKFVDSEVLRRCSPRVPFQIGTLEKSGKLGTTVGSGIVELYCTIRQKTILGHFRNESL